MAMWVIHVIKAKSRGTSEKASAGPQILGNTKRSPQWNHFPTGSLLSAYSLVTSLTANSVNLTRDLGSILRPSQVKSSQVPTLHTNTK